MTDTFDPNFCFPVKDLENDWVKLTPLNVRLVDPSKMRSLVIDENDRTFITSITLLNPIGNLDLLLFVHTLHCVLYEYSLRSTVTGTGTTPKTIPKSTSTSPSAPPTHRSNSSEPSSQKGSSHNEDSSSMQRTTRSSSPTPPHQE